MLASTPGELALEGVGDAVAVLGPSWPWGFSPIDECVGSRAEGKAVETEDVEGFEVEVGAREHNVIELLCGHRSITFALLSPPHLLPP